MQTVCARCGMDLADAVDCPAGYPTDCAMRQALALPAPSLGAVDLETWRPSQLERGAGALAEGVAFGALELLGLVVSPLTLGASGMITSLIALVYTASRDLEGGRYRLIPRTVGSRVIDVETGAPATRQQALRRNLPMVLAWALAVLPDPVGLLGWAALGFVLAVDAMLVLVRRDGRRLGDLLAGTAVVRPPRD